MTPELFELLWKAAAIVFAAGAVWGELRGIRKDIARLEEPFAGARGAAGGQLCQCAQAH